VGFTFPFHRERQRIPGQDLGEPAPRISQLYPQLTTVARGRSGGLDEALGVLHLDHDPLPRPREQVNMGGPHRDDGFGQGPGGLEGDAVLQDQRIAAAAFRDVHFGREIGLEAARIIRIHALALERAVAVGGHQVDPGAGRRDALDTIGLGIDVDGEIGYVQPLLTLPKVFVVYREMKAMPGEDGHGLRDSDSAFPEGKLDIAVAGGWTRADG
jgi:hypothetical protein